MMVVNLSLFPLRTAAERGLLPAYRPVYALPPPGEGQNAAEDSANEVAGVPVSEVGGAGTPRQIFCVVFIAASRPVAADNGLRR